MPRPEPTPVDRERLAATIAEVSPPVDRGPIEDLTGVLLELQAQARFLDRLSRVLPTKLAAPAGSLSLRIARAVEETFPSRRTGAP